MKKNLLRLLGVSILALNIFYAKEISFFIVNTMGMASIALLFYFPLVYTIAIAAIIGKEE